MISPLTWPHWVWATLEKLSQLIRTLERTAGRQMIGAAASGMLNQPNRVILIGVLLKQKPDRSLLPLPTLQMVLSAIVVETARRRGRLASHEAMRGKREEGTETWETIEMEVMIRDTLHVIDMNPTMIVREDIEAEKMITIEVLGTSERAGENTTTHNARKGEDLTIVADRKRETWIEGERATITIEIDTIASQITMVEADMATEKIMVIETEAIVPGMTVEVAKVVGIMSQDKGATMIVVGREDGTERMDELEMGIADEVVMGVTKMANRVTEVNRDNVEVIRGGEDMITAIRMVTLDTAAITITSKADSYRVVTLRMVRDIDPVIPKNSLRDQEREKL